MKEPAGRGHRLMTATSIRNPGSLVRGFLLWFRPLRRYDLADSFLEPLPCVGLGFDLFGLRLL